MSLSSARFITLGFFICLCVANGAEAQLTASNLAAVQDIIQPIVAGATNSSASVIDFRDLKALLPPDLTGMKRTNAGGEKETAMGVTISYAEATYEGPDDAIVNVKITDNGGLGAIMAMADLGWVTTEIDRETDYGYAKTSTIGGYKAYEEYNRDNKTGGIQVLVDERFVVDIEGSGVAMDSIKECASKIDLAKLASLKNQEATKK